MGGNATDVWREKWRREGERGVEGGGGGGRMEGGGGATAAYQWVPFKFPGIIGGKKEGGREGERKMMHASSDRWWLGEPILFLLYPLCLLLKWVKQQPAVLFSWLSTVLLCTEPLRNLHHHHPLPRVWWWSVSGRCFLRRGDVLMCDDRSERWGVGLGGGGKDIKLKVSSCWLPPSWLQFFIINRNGGRALSTVLLFRCNSNSAHIHRWQRACTGRKYILLSIITIPTTGRNLSNTGNTIKRINAILASGLIAMPVTQHLASVLESECKRFRRISLRSSYL